MHMKTDVGMGILCKPLYRLPISEDMRLRPLQFFFSHLKEDRAVVTSSIDPPV